MSDKDLRKFKLKKASLKSYLTKTTNYLDTINADTKLVFLKTRYSKLVSSLKEFDETQLEIELLENLETQSDEREKYEDDCLSVISQLQEHINLQESNTVIHTINQTSLSNSPQQSNNIRLPTINLPTFSGKYEEWVPFYDIFKSMIHTDISISEIQKFHYLKSSLSGDAATVLDSLSISSENYKIAWEMLKSRYDNKRIIIQQHIKSIFELPYVAKENFSGLRRILDGILKHTRALKALGRPTDQWDDLLVYIITTKIDAVTNKEWETFLPSTTAIPTFASIVDFLNKKCQTLENMCLKSLPNTSYLPIKQTSHVLTTLNCKICSGSHMIYQCNKFLKMIPNQRLDQAKAKRLCVNCLRSNHTVQQCKSTSCKTCGKRHHSLLHIESMNKHIHEESKVTPTVTHHTADGHSHKESILSTAVVLVNDIKGHWRECRVLLDCGSQSNFVSKAFADHLGIPQEPFSLPVIGINQTHTHINRCMTTTVKSRFNAFQTTLKCLIIPQVTSNLPSTTLDLSKFDLPKNIRLADPEFHISRPIDMLIGVDLFWRLMCVGQIKPSSRQPYIQKTHFGWIIAGPFTPYAPIANVSVCNLSATQELDKKLSKFWELEECNIKNKYTPEETACETHFQNNTRRNQDGRYIVKLPFKETSKSLGQSYSIAFKRFCNLEKRLNKNPHLKDQYVNFMHEYINLRHMKPVKINFTPTDQSPYFYLPHHAVEKCESTTTKLRVVFDGSCKTSSGFSLNDMLMVGPTIQQDLFSIITRFRTHQIAITADIAKMYRQVLLDKEDTKYQRILWRSNPHEEIRIYELSTVTYGTAPAAFLAIRALQQLAADEQEEFPIGSHIATRDFYVDDLITGANTNEEAIIIIDQINNLLKRGGFELRKWHTNNIEIINAVDINSSKETIHCIDKSNGVKTLGLLWNTIDDVFLYDVPQRSAPFKVCKRYILSFVSSLFDPLGLLGPIVIKGKLFIQKLWQLKVDWDESIPMDLYTEFTTYQHELDELKCLRIPRKVIPHSQKCTLELHGFSDACQTSYGACVYVRSIYSDGQTSCTLLAAKSKVAPIKFTTIPRLELCAALLLSQLVEKITSSINIKFDTLLYWTDSTIVLAWIKSTTKQWKTFVANRINEIHQFSNPNQWHHVRSEDNPADIISRGTSPSNLMDSELWWHGPHWLRENFGYDTLTVPSPKEEQELPEEKITKSCLITSIQSTNDIFTKFSSFVKLLRITAFCLRFINNIRSRLLNDSNGQHTSTLSSDEINIASNKLTFLVQREHFTKEINDLITIGAVSSKSKLLSLNPFLDQNQIIRVGGRIKNSKLPYDNKHPILLPAKHIFTTLIIEYYHKQQLHAGVQGTIAAIRSKYWPLSLKNNVKDALRKCVTCFKVKPTNETYLMGNLPKTRLEPGRPFSNCGVDFCGPFEIRERSRRNIKTFKIYVAIFVCFATKAVHIEIVTDLTSECFVNTLKRIIARRGKILNLYSDNATNFVGANNELRKLFNAFKSDESREFLIRRLSEDNFKWHFIPPRSPHFGGLWEAGVKSIKHHLRRVAGNIILTYEQMHTLLIQIESILNSRPLTPLSNDPNDFAFLTPGHFLIGDSFSAIPEPSLLELPVNRLSHWQHVERLKQHIWQRWHKEYLNTLQQRSKWKSQENKCSLHPNQLVLIKEDNLPPLRWRTGRIEEVHSGEDGVVRTATIRTVGELLKRPATKLYALPVD